MKRVLSIIAGVVSGFIVVFIGDAVVHALHPMPLGLNYMDKSVMVNYIAGIPRYILGLMTFFWILSAFTGGLVTGLIAKRNDWRKPCMVTGGILLAAALLNLIMTAPSHPLWMWLVAIVFYLPFALLGGLLMNRKKITPAV